MYSACAYSYGHDIGSDAWPRACVPSTWVRGNGSNLQRALGDRVKAWMRANWFALAHSPVDIPDGPERRPDGLAGPWLRLGAAKRRARRLARAYFRHL